VTRKRHPITIHPPDLDTFYRTHPNLVPPTKDNTPVDHTTTTQPSTQTAEPSPKSQPPKPVQRSSKKTSQSKQKKGTTQPHSKRQTHTRADASKPLGSSSKITKKLIVFPDVVAQRLKTLAAVLGEDESTIVRQGVTELYERKIASGLIQ
jgi:hypothetical protein